MTVIMERRMKTTRRTELVFAKVLLHSGLTTSWGKFTGINLMPLSLFAITNVSTWLVSPARVPLLLLDVVDGVAEGVQVRQLLRVQVLHLAVPVGQRLW